MNKALAIAGVVIKELYRRKDFYVLLFLTFLITAGLGVINFFNETTIVRYLKEVCLLLIWVSSLVICITTAARQIPAERENRTIFPLLAKPVTRWDVVLGKFLGCWAACGIALLVFYVFFAIGGELRRPASSSAPLAAASTNVEAQATAPAVAESHEGHDHDAHGHEGHDHDAHETEPARSPFINYVQAFWLHWMMLGVVTAMVLLGSVVFAAPSSNFTITFVVVSGILLMGEHLHKVALRMTEPSQTILTIIYFVIPHLEWDDIRQRVIYDHAPIAWVNCGLATLYAWAYTLLFLYLTWLIFRRKSVTI